MSLEWMLTCYCDKCHAGQHFEGKTVLACCWQAQHEGWLEDNNGTVLCKKCQERICYENTDKRAD